MRAETIRIIDRYGRRVDTTRSLTDGAMSAVALDRHREVVWWYYPRMTYKQRTDFKDWLEKRGKRDPGFVSLLIDLEEWEASA